MRKLHSIVSAGLVALIKGRARQHIQAALQKAYENEMIDQCFDSNGKAKLMEEANRMRHQHSIYYIWQALIDTDKESTQKYLGLISTMHCANTCLL